MIELSTLPTVNAVLNSIAFVFLVVGHHFIRRGRVTAHKRCMVTAFCTSILFLATYLTYRFLGEEKRFGGAGWVRGVYFFILITHVTLAAIVPFLASRTLYLALQGRFEAHRRIARVTYPIWVYVSVTGVLVYLMLFKGFLAGQGGNSANVGKMDEVKLGWCVVWRQENDAPTHGLPLARF